MILEAKKEFYTVYKTERVEGNTTTLSSKVIYDNKFGYCNIKDRKLHYVSLEGTDYFSHIRIWFKGKEMMCNCYDISNYNVIMTYPEIFKNINPKTEFGTITHYIEQGIRDKTICIDKINTMIDKHLLNYRKGYFNEDTNRLNNK